MKSTAFYPFLAALVSATGSGSAEARDPAPTLDSEDVRIASFIYNGSGCPRDTLSPSLTEDGASFSLRFRDFSAEVGRGAEVSDRRQNCVLRLDLRAPSGWSFAVASVDIAGRLRLDDRVSGVVTTRVYFSGERREARGETRFEPGTRLRFRATQHIPAEERVWSSCEGRRPLNINVSARVRGPQDAVGSLALSSVSELHLVWRRCS